MDREAFLPLRNDEVTDQEAVCRGSVSRMAMMPLG